MTSVQQKYSALKKKYIKLLASYRKISDLSTDKNNKIIGGAEGSGNSNNKLQNYVEYYDIHLQELIWDYQDNLPYVENLFQIIDYIFIKFSLFEIYKKKEDKKDICKHFESDFKNWKNPENADILNTCVKFLMKNIKACRQYFYNKYEIIHIDDSDIENAISDIVRYYNFNKNIFEYFGPICCNNDVSEKTNCMKVDDIAQLYGFRIVDACGSVDKNSFFGSIIHQLSGLTISLDNKNNHSKLKNEFTKYINDNIGEIKDSLNDEYIYTDNYDDIIKNLEIQIGKIKSGQIWVHDDIFICAVCDIIGKNIVIYEKRETNNNNEYKIIPLDTYTHLLKERNSKDEIYLLYHDDRSYYESLVPLDKQVETIDPRTDDPYNLQRFIDKQEKYFEIALDEIKSDKQRTHWLIFGIPAHCSHLNNNDDFSLPDINAAKAYLHFETRKGVNLRRNLIQIFTIINQKQKLDKNYDFLNNFFLGEEEKDLVIDSIKFFHHASSSIKDNEVYGLCDQILNTHYGISYININKYDIIRYGNQSSTCSINKSGYFKIES
jgi:uncharacterized protein (DUF1810 family)